MDTYIVFTRESTRDQQELDAYQANVAKTSSAIPSKSLPPTDRNNCLKERQPRES